MGRKKFDTPWQKIAADINKSSSITAFDMIHLLRILLGQENSFPNNNSWRFVDKKQAHLIPENPFEIDFDAKIQISHSCSENLYDVDLIAIKVGDVVRFN